MKCISWFFKLDWYRYTMEFEHIKTIEHFIFQILGHLVTWFFNFFQLLSININISNNYYLQVITILFFLVKNNVKWSVSLVPVDCCPFFFINFEYFSCYGRTNNLHPYTHCLDNELFSSFFCCTFQFFFWCIWLW